MDLLESLLHGGLRAYVASERETWLERLLVAARKQLPVTVEMAPVIGAGKYHLFVNGIQIDTRYTVEFAKQRHKEIRNILKKHGFSVV